MIYFKKIEKIQKINKEALYNRILIKRIISLKGLWIIYLISFLSLYGQIQGIGGNDGLFPSNCFLSKLKETLKSYKYYYFFYPTIAWLFDYNTYAMEYLLYILCLTGIIIPILYNEYFLNSLFYFILWYIHYNFIILGQSFMRFALDGLLSEIGFISIFFASFSFKSINYIFQLNNISFYALKFILAKFMVSTGINILGSQYPDWTTFNGLSFFFKANFYYLLYRFISIII